MKPGDLCTVNRAGNNSSLWTSLDLSDDRNEGKFFCGCVACEQWRAARIVPGVLCKPATQDPKRMAPGTVPFWKPGSRESGPPRGGAFAWKIVASAWSQ